MGIFYWRLVLTILLFLMDVMTWTLLYFPIGCWFTLFGAHQWFRIYSYIQSVYRNSGKLWAGQYSRNLVWDLLDGILHSNYMKSLLGYPTNVAVTDCMSYFSMFVPTKATVKIANEKRGHSQEIGINLCNLSYFPIIYPVVLVYYCPGHPTNTISSGDLDNNKLVPRDI